ncbi:MAG: hypothetical protein QM808_16250 [Steroidobacteraceae bacterium]
MGDVINVDFAAASASRDWNNVKVAALKSIKLFAQGHDEATQEELACEIVELNKSLVNAKYTFHPEKLEMSAEALSDPIELGRLLENYLRTYTQSVVQEVTLRCIGLSCSHVNVIMGLMAGVSFK